MMRGPHCKLMVFTPHQIQLSPIEAIMNPNGANFVRIGAACSLIHGVSA